MNTHKIFRFLSGLTILAVVAVPLGASALTATTTVASIVGATISVTTSGGSVALGVTTASGVKQTVASDTVTVSANDSAGYQLTLQANVAALTCGACAGTPTIAAGSGTCASPAALATNTWGYRLVTGAAVDTVNFPCNATTAFGTAVPTVATNAAVTAETYSAVPTASADMIKQTAVVASNDTTVVYYKAEVDTTKASGTYNGVTVTYTSIAR